MNKTNYLSCKFIQVSVFCSTIVRLQWKTYIIITLKLGGRGGGGCC
jgi:hypothetical protein